MWEAELSGLDWWIRSTQLWKLSTFYLSIGHNHHHWLNSRKQLILTVAQLWKWPSFVWYISWHFVSYDLWLSTDPTKAFFAMHTLHDCKYSLLSKTLSPLILHNIFLIQIWSCVCAGKEAKLGENSNWNNLHISHCNISNPIVFNASVEARLPQSFFRSASISLTHLLAD